MKFFSPSRPKILQFNKFLTKIAQKNSFLSGALKYSMESYKQEIANLRFVKVIGT